MLTAKWIAQHLAATMCVGLLSGCAHSPVPTHESLAPPLRLLNDCPDTQYTCVEMLLNLGDRLYGKFDPYRDFQQGEMDKTGYSEFIIPVEGRLNGTDAGFYRLFFRAYTDGINCTDFGQGNVASLGFSVAENPVLLTDAGPLELVDSSLDVGCSECGRLISKDTGEAVREFTTPSWDLSLVGLTGRMENHFVFDDEARIFLRYYSSGKASRCLRIPDDKFFRTVDAAHCATTTRFVVYPETLANGGVDIESEPGVWILENSGSSSYYMKVIAGACS